MTEEDVNVSSRFIEIGQFSLPKTSKLDQIVLLIGTT